jgi:hypothetical protein
MDMVGVLNEWKSRILPESALREAGAGSLFLRAENRGPLLAEMREPGTPPHGVLMGQRA